MIRNLRSAAVTLAAATVLALAGCSGTSTPTASGSAQNAGPVTLTYWDFIDPSQNNARSKALKDNVAAFEAANPDIKIDVQVVTLGDMLNRLPQAAAAGQAPDVFKMFSPVVGQMAAAGAYSPLPAAASKVTDWLRPVDAFSNAKGQPIAVPYEYRTCTLYYNDKILKKIGAAVPTTYAEMIDVAGKAAKAGYTGFGSGFSDTDNSAIIGTWFDCFMTQVGQDLWNNKGQAIFATEKGNEFGNILAGLRDAGAFSSSVVSDTYGNVADGLTNGTVAMAVLGTERIAGLSTGNPDVKWTSLPRASVGDTTGTTMGWTLGIGAGSKHVDAAWRFIEYMTAPEAAARMATGGEVPTRAASYQAPFFSTPDAAIVNAVAKYVQSNSKPRLYSDNWTTLAKGLSDAGQKLIVNHTSGSEFITSAQAAANQ